MAMLVTHDPERKWQRRRRAFTTGWRDGRLRTQGCGVAGAFGCSPRSSVTSLARMLLDRDFLELRCLLQSDEQLLPYPRRAAEGKCRSGHVSLTAAPRVRNPSPSRGESANHRSLIGGAVSGYAGGGADTGTTRWLAPALPGVPVRGVLALSEAPTHG